MNENNQVNTASLYEDLSRTRTRIDSDKVRMPPILVSGRFGDADIERAKQQLASLRTDLNLKRSVPNVTVVVTSLPSGSTPEPSCDTPTAKLTVEVPSKRSSDGEPLLPHVPEKPRAPPKAAPPPIPPRSVPVSATPAVPGKIPPGPPAAGKAPPAPPMAKKAPPPPPPPRLSLGHGAQPRPSLGGSAPVAPINHNDFLNIHWKPAATLPPVIDNNDQFLKPFIDSDSVTSSTVKKLLLLDPVPPVIDPVTSVFQREAATPPPCVSVDTLKHFFQKKQNKLDIGGTGSSSLDTFGRENGRKSALEKERLKLIALAIGGSLGIRSSGNKRGIFRQYRNAIIRCDYSVVKTEILCPLLQLLNNVTLEEMNSVVSLVKDTVPIGSIPGGEEECRILDDFEEPDVFLYEMSKIPEIKTRIECMILEQSFEDLFQMTLNSLNVIYTALECIHDKLDDIARLFQLILKVGNALNEGSKLGGSQVNFSLSTLAKLAELKSSLDPKVDLLHYILSHIPAEDSPSIFSDSDIVKLKNAANLRCFRVRDEVKDLLESVNAIVDIIRNPVPVATGSIGEEDLFNERMKKFSETIGGTERWLSIYALNVFRSYKNLSNFFEDSRAAYPPPKEKSNDQFDIIELFAWFASVLRAHEKDIKRLKLRQKMGTVGNGVVINRGKSRRPSANTQDAIHTSIKALAGDNSVPIAALITRQSGDLTASKPKLSPLPSPVVDVVVVPASSESIVKPVTSAPTRRILTTRGTASIVSARNTSIPQASLSVAVSGPPIPTRKNSLEGQTDSYPVRREGLPDPDFTMNTRVSLSNTISRVAMMLSPSRDDSTSASAFMGARRRASFVAPNPDGAEDFPKAENH